MVAILALACGGRLAEADGGVDASQSPPPPTPTRDAAPPPPPPPDAGPLPPQDAGPPAMCGPMTTDKTTNASYCNLTERWLCGQDMYLVECICPNGRCTCAPPGQGKFDVPYTNGCPACAYGGKQAAQLCGFPSQ